MRLPWRVPGETRRMLMLYDTLLEGGEYRLGMRFARPVDQRLEQPLYNEEAIAAIQDETFQIDEDLAVPLGLSPLSDIGTRVIVPFLDEDLATAMQPGGEFERWLQRCWWRAIQTGRLRIRVVDDETAMAKDIVVPSWWADLPRHKDRPSSAGRWTELPDDGRACVWGDMTFGDGHRIRRLVLMHSDSLSEDEIDRDYAEYAGIQILRGSQWIETRGARQDFGDHIPIDKRHGFRGFVEFDKHTDSALRAAENSQHDGFDARGKRGEIVRELRDQLHICTSEFSAAMGWATATTIGTQQVSQREKSTHARFMETFLNPNGRKPKPSSHAGEDEGTRLLWDCRLDLEYPDPDSARVDWGQALRNVYVELGVEPSEELIGSVDLILEWMDDSGKAQEIRRSEDAISKQWGSDRIQQRIEFGDWQILRGKASREQQIECPEPGEFRLRTVVMYRGQRVKSAARSVYVQSEPPPPPEKNPVTVSISAYNISASDKINRIDHGEELQIQIIARNRGTEPGAFRLTASFADEVLVRSEALALEGTPAGDTAQPIPILTARRQLLDPAQPMPLALNDAEQLTMPDSSGKYAVRADLTDERGDVIASDSRIVYFQRDPGNARNNLPFEIEQKDQKPIWELNKDLDLLTYSGDYPLYTEMKEIQRQRRALQGRLAFIAEISANGLLEWTLRPKHHGSDSNYDQLYDENRATDDPLWESLNRRLEELSATAESPIQFMQTWRETVAIMLEIFAREND